MGSVVEARGVVRIAVNSLRRWWYLVVTCSIVFGVAGLVYSLCETPQFNSTATLYVTSGSDDNTSAAYQGSLASQQRVASYTKLVGSNAVVSEAVRAAGLNLSVEDASRKVFGNASMDTVLLYVTATSDNPQLSSVLANAVAKAMINYVSELETPSGGGNPLAKLTLVSPAAPSADPVTPKTSRNVALGLFFGFVFGVFLVILRSRFSEKVRSSSQLAVLDTTVLGVVPRDRRLGMNAVLEFGSGSSPAAEAYRRVRAGLSFASVDAPPRVILVTSAREGEGKTTTAVNLAVAIAESGKNVVLVDGDLRRPRLAKRFGMGDTIGFSNLIRGDCEVSMALQQSSFERLYICASGLKPPNPSELR